jgi:REP element-mobilizing transposase RayT
MELSHASHHIYRLEYHLVWIPKYRHPVFREPQRGMRKYFWGGKLWTPSYYAETVGKRNEAAIRTYIRNQLVAETTHLARLRQLKLFPSA